MMTDTSIIKTITTIIFQLTLIFSNFPYVRPAEGKIASRWESGLDKEYPDNQHRTCENIVTHLSSGTP